MSGNCGKKPHTPITTEAQRRLFRAKAGGAKTKAPSLSVAEAKRHLKEVAGKELPARKALARRARGK